MKQFKYGNIQAFAEKRKRDDRLLRWLIVAAVGAMMASVILGDMLFFRPKERYIEGRFAASNINSRGDERIWNVWIKSTNRAVDLWREKGLLVPAGIRLVHDPSACGPEAIACASETKKTIWVANDGDGIDRTSVMLHEVAHILGVPHIEGDKLMDAKYSGLVEEPTEAAVALAKLSAAEEK